jgi:hypothetical protein
LPAIRASHANHREEDLSRNGGWKNLEADEKYAPISGN